MTKPVAVVIGAGVHPTASIRAIRDEHSSGVSSMGTVQASGCSKSSESPGTYVRPSEPLITFWDVSLIVAPKPLPGS